MKKPFLIQFLKCTDQIINVGIYDEKKDGYFTGDGIINKNFDLKTFYYKSFEHLDFFNLIEKSL